MRKWAAIGRAVPDHTLCAQIMMLLRQEWCSSGTGRYPALQLLALLSCLSSCSWSYSPAAFQGVIVSSILNNHTRSTTPQSSTARKANFLSAHDKTDIVHTLLGEYVSSRRRTREVDRYISLMYFEQDAAIKQIRPSCQRSNSHSSLSRRPW